MFEAKDIYPDIKLEDLFNHVSEYDIFKRYCTNFEEINKSFLSDLYADKNPDCRIFLDKNSSLKYKDFGEEEHYFSCFDYVMVKYNCTFQECIRMIANDFGLLKISLDRKPKYLLGEEKELGLVKPIFQSTITVVPRSWNLWDFNFWYKRFNITFKTASFFNYFPIRHAYLHKEDKTLVFTSTKDNPLYASKEYDWETGEFIGYKIYAPLHPNREYKWLSSPNISKSIAGWEELPEEGDLLLITKSRKDVAALYGLGYLAIAPHAEGILIPEQVMDNLKKRFGKIIVLYDNDSKGVESARKMIIKYPYLTAIFYPNSSSCKDTCEMINRFGPTGVGLSLKELINEETFAV